MVDSLHEGSAGLLARFRRRVLFAGGRIVPWLNAIFDCLRRLEAGLNVGQ